MSAIALSTHARGWVSNAIHSKPSMLHKLAGEFIGCMLFHFIGSVAPTAIANGIALLYLVYLTAKISGAHLNPAVTLTFTLLGHTNPFEMVLYWIAQVGGCALGALWIAALVPSANIRNSRNYLVNPQTGGVYHDGCFTPVTSLTDAQVFGWEALCTYSFITPIFSVVWYTQQKKGYGNTGPLIVGLALFANALACGPFTGGAMNPARVLGSPIVFDCPYTKLHIYILGEIAGAIAATLTIIPWYGISKEPWYELMAPRFVKKMAARSERSIILQTMTKQDIVAHETRSVTE